MYGKFLAVLVLSAAVGGGFLFIPNTLWSARSEIQQELQELRAKNAALIAERTVSPQQSVKWLTARVHSTYPLNNKNEITIAAGAEEGITLGAPVTVGGDALLGKITAVFPHYSVVQTVADSSWRLPVRIGSGGADALMKGGPAITLTFVEKEKDLAEGDAVYTTGKSVPYGLAVGFVAKIFRDATSVFQEAEMALPYQLNRIQEVVVLNDY